GGRAAWRFVLQPPFRFFRWPPVEGIEEFGVVGRLAADPAVVDFPLFVPAPLVDRLFDTTNVLVVTDDLEPRFPQRLADSRPIGRDQTNRLGEIALGRGPQVERPLLALKREF